MLDILEYMNDDGTITERLRHPLWEFAPMPLTPDMIKQMLHGSFDILPMHAPDNQTATEVMIRVMQMNEARDKIAKRRHMTWYGSYGQ
jgi:hypothetical protein